MKKTKTVYDTNVIIDFKAGKIREAMFSSGETVAINREVYEDELRKERKYLAQYQRTGVLEIINRNKQIDSLFFYLKKYETARTDLYDLLCLASALYLSAPLATGDRELRAAATKEKCQLTGTVGIAKKIVEAGFNADDMLAAFDLMKQRRRRLPWALAKQEIEKLRKKSA